MSVIARLEFELLLRYRSLVLHPGNHTSEQKFDVLQWRLTENVDTFYIYSHDFGKNMKVIQ